MSMHGVDRPTGKTAPRSSRSHPSNRLLSLAPTPAPAREDGVCSIGRLYLTPDERHELMLDLVHHDRSPAAVARQYGLPSRLVQRWLDEFLDDLCRTLA